RGSGCARLGSGPAGTGAGITGRSFRAISSGDAPPPRGGPGRREPRPRGDLARRRWRSPAALGPGWPEAPGRAPVPSRRARRGDGPAHTFVRPIELGTGQVAVGDLEGPFRAGLPGDPRRPGVGPSQVEVVAVLAVRLPSVEPGGLELELPPEDPRGEDAEADV